MDHVQPIIQPVRKYSGLDQQVERRGGDGNHLRVAVLRLVEPEDEPLLLITIQAIHIPKNQRSVGRQTGRKRAAGMACCRSTSAGNDTSMA